MKDEFKLVQGREGQGNMLFSVIIAFALVAHYTPPVREFRDFLKKELFSKVQGTANCSAPECKRT